MKIHLAFLAAALLSPTQASAIDVAATADPVAAKVDRMTDLLDRAVPMGVIFETIMKDDPAWPVQANPAALDATQLACLRGELGQDGVRRNKRAEVEAYVAGHAKQVDGEIELMDGGAADMMNKFMLAGAKGESSQKQQDVNAVISNATPEQALSFMRFITAPEFTELRKLAGIGDVFDPTSSAEQNEKSGQRLGASLGSTAILKAFGTCKIPMSALFAPGQKDS
jgi:hypothetical protein